MDSVVETVTATARSTGLEASAVEAEIITDIAAGTGVKVGYKGIHPTPTTPNMYRDISEVVRTTVTEVGWDE